MICSRGVASGPPNNANSPLSAYVCIHPQDAEQTAVDLMAEYQAAADEEARQREVAFAEQLKSQIDRRQAHTHTYTHCTRRFILSHLNTATATPTAERPHL